MRNGGGAGAGAGREDGPRARLTRLYEEHSAAVIGYAGRRVGPNSVADVVADTFAVAWRRLDQVPDEPLPWLLAVARRVIANHHRSQRHRLTAIVVYGRDGRVVSSGEVPSPTRPGSYPCLDRTFRIARTRLCR